MMNQAGEHGSLLRYPKGATTFIGGCSPRVLSVCWKRITSNKFLEFLILRGGELDTADQPRQVLVAHLPRPRIRLRDIVGSLGSTSSPASARP
jgi:hypothetical protein